jgi:hypothetical protein
VPDDGAFGVLDPIAMAMTRKAVNAPFISLF